MQLRLLVTLTAIACAATLAACGQESNKAADAAKKAATEAAEKTKEAAAKAARGWAFPMCARVVQKVGLEANPGNHLIMHAAGANTAGQIASVVAWGAALVLLPFFG